MTTFSWCMHGTFVWICGPHVYTWSRYFSIDNTRYNYNYFFDAKVAICMEF